MKIAKLFAYLIIAIFLPLWLFILMDNNLIKEKEDKDLLDKIEALFKFQKKDGETVPPTNTTINHSFIQFHYNPRNTYLTNPSIKGGMPLSLPESIKIDTQSFSGIIDEISSLQKKINIDHQILNKKLDEFKESQKGPIKMTGLKSIESNSFKYEFSEVKMEVWEIQLGDLEGNSDTIMLILKNTSRFYTVSIESITDERHFKIVQSKLPNKLKIPPLGEFVLEYYKDNTSNTTQSCAISLTYRSFLLPSKEGQLTLIINN